MKNSLTQQIRAWAQGRTGRFLLTQLAHMTTTVVILAALLLGAAQVGALDGMLAPLTAPTDDTSFTTVNYQGRLADSGGAPINNTNPGIGMTFALYDVESGGSPVWVETHANVPVSEGLFSVRLGSINALDTRHLTGDRWLGIQVGTDPEMAPREKLTAVPYAMEAGSVVDGAIGTAQIVDGAVTRAKAPGLIASTANNTEIQYGQVVAQATGTTGVLTVDIDFVPDFPSDPHLLLQPLYYYTPYVIATYGQPCDETMCRVFLVRTDGGTWQNGQNQGINWIAIGQR